MSRSLDQKLFEYGNNGRRVRYESLMHFCNNASTQMLHDVISVSPRDELSQL